MTKKESEKSFEEAYNQLKEVVERLENSDTDLEESLEIFEQGIRLINYCNKKLEDAEHKFQKLVKDDKNNLHLEDIKE
ncbi:MAG: exodeoxyribonuclease VII small subunit [bacterium]